MGDRLPPRWTHPTTYAHVCSPRSRRTSSVRSRPAWQASIPPRRRRPTRPSRSRPRAGTSRASSRRRERVRPSPMTWTRTAASSRRGARARRTTRGPKSPSPSGPCASPRRWASACTCRRAPRRRATRLVAEVSYADYDKVEVATDRETRSRTRGNASRMGPSRSRFRSTRRPSRRASVSPARVGCASGRAAHHRDGRPRARRARAQPLPRQRPRGARAGSRPQLRVPGALALRYERGFLWRPNRKGEDAGTTTTSACSRCSSAIVASGPSVTTRAS
jgi:hypothetical protein